MKTLRLLWPYLKRSRFLAVFSLLLATISVVCKMAIPFVTGLAIDQLKAGNLEIAPYLFWMVGLLLCGALFRYFFDFVLSYIGQRVVKQMRDELFDSINSLPLSYLDSKPHGDLLLRLTSDIETVQTGLIAGAGALYEGVVQILVTMAFMFYVHWLLAVAVVVLTPISVIVSRFVSKANSVYFKKQNKQLGELTAYSLETITTLEAVRAYGLEEARGQEFSARNKEAKEANYRATFASSWINPSTRLVNNLIYAVVLLLGAFILMKEPPLGVPFTLGALSAFLVYAFQYMTPFNEVSNVASEVFFASAALSRVEEVIHQEKDIDEGRNPLKGTVDSLKANHIHFGYDPEKTIIKDFDIEIYRGHKIALVGTTGCGKTTIINLLMRFYDPQKGGFETNGLPTQDIQKKELRSHFGMVLQDTWLSHGTVAENIAFGKEGASQEEIVEAAKKAHADDFIRRLPQGYETRIGNDSGLSTGEKQLLCVARIMLAEPEIVLLDEATSNIDLITELHLAKAFDELMSGKTSLVVAHRLSTIKNADLILVMKDGSIIEQGNFKELLEKKGFFASLYQAQFA